MEDIYECYAVVRFAKPDLSRDSKNVIQATVEVFDYDLEAAKKRAIEISKYNFHERVYIFKQVYDVQDDDEPTVGIRLKSGKRINDETPI